MHKWQGLYSLKPRLLQPLRGKIKSLYEAEKHGDNNKKNVKNAFNLQTSNKLKIYSLLTFGSSNAGSISTGRKSLYQD